MIQDYKRLGINTPPIKKTSINRPTIIAAPKYLDKEQDESLISSHTAVRRIVHQYINQSKEEALQSDDTSLSRILLNKSGTKFPRYCATMQLLYYSIKYCRQLTKFIKFDNGFHLNRTIDFDNLNNFVIAADHFLTEKFQKKKAKGFFDGKVILPIKKASVLSAKYLYDYSMQTALKLYKPPDIHDSGARRKLPLTNLSSSTNQTDQNSRDVNIISYVIHFFKFILLFFFST